eukprot:8422724-Lingulodinium_polyedra.AAC.1
MVIGGRALASSHCRQTCCACSCVACVTEVRCSFDLAPRQWRGAARVGSEVVVTALRGGAWHGGRL